MLKNLTRIEIGTILTIIGMIISATVFLTTLSVRQGDLRGRIESLERGISLDDNKKKAIQELKDVVQEYSIFEIPVGSIISFYGKEIPKGFLLCDGSQFTKISEPRLFDFFKSQFPHLIITDEIGKLPDLKGMFLRGAGRVLKSKKLSIVGRIEDYNAGAHTHKYSRITKLYASHKDGNPPMGWFDVPENGNSSKVRTGEGGDAGNKFGFLLQSTQLDTKAPDLEDETRPPNVSVNFLIKT